MVLFAAIKMMIDALMNISGSESSRAVQRKCRFFSDELGATAAKNSSRAKGDAIVPHCLFFPPEILEDERGPIAKARKEETLTVYFQIEIILPLAVYNNASNIL